MICASHAYSKSKWHVVIEASAYGIRRWGRHRPLSGPNGGNVSKNFAIKFIKLA